MKLRRGLDRAQDAHTVLVGTPDQVAAKAKRLLSIVRPGVLIFLHIQGPVGNDDRMRSLQLLAEEVTPALRDHAQRIGLVDQFERVPSSVKLASGAARDAVVDRAELKELAAL
jgi:hypothetical protein